MKPKPGRFLFSSVVALAIAGLSGCASAPDPTAGHATILVAIQMADGRAPTRAQADRIQRAVAPDLARTGLMQARSREQADYVLTVVFTPDPVNPEGGHIAVGRIEPIRRVTNNTAVYQDPLASMKRDQEREMARTGTGEVSRD